jgi:hypothetical protein
MGRIAAVIGGKDENIGKISFWVEVWRESDRWAQGFSVLCFTKDYNAI